MPTTFQRPITYSLQDEEQKAKFWMAKTFSGDLIAAMQLLAWFLAWEIVR